MPEMELFGPDLRLSLISGIWTRLLAYMLWPSNEEQRKAHCAKPFIGALASIDRKSDDDPDYAAAHWIVYGAFRKINGWSAVEGADRLDLKGIGRRLRTAAAVLDIVRKSPKGSLNKAIHVIEATAKNYKLIGNRTDILKAWKSHRGVAHLGIALIFSDKFQEPSEYSDPRLLRRFLVIARDYQDFVREKGLVKETEIWSIPAIFRKLPSLRRPLQPLPDDMIAALESYRAPH